MSLKFKKKLNTYDVKMKKSTHELQTHLESNDADECMVGKKCVNLAVQVKKFIDNFEKA